MRIEIPKLCVVAMIGASGSGKSSFAKQHFKPTEVLSSDYFRGLVADDENNQSVSKAAFDALYYIAEKRLAANKLVVIDATNVQQSARSAGVALAKKFDVLPVAIVMNTPEAVCIQRNKARPDRQFGEHVVKRHCLELKKSLRHLKKEGFRYIYVIDDPEEDVVISRIPAWTDKSEEHGPFDIIGDVHGCFDELCALLAKMGYTVDQDQFTAFHAAGRKAVFLGDLCDRGPKIAETLKLAMNMGKAGNALCVPGNHDIKLLRFLKGAKVQQTHGLEDSVNQLAGQPAAWIAELKAFLDSLIGHYVLDDGRLVVAHAGMKEAYQGKSSGRVRDFALFGDTTGESDEYGLPVRLDWASEYRGKAKVVYGHTPTAEVYQVNNTLNIDTGCVFGGKLTAYRYPEAELVSVPALETYYEPIKPLCVQEEYSDVLNIADVLEKRYIETGLHRGVTIREENAAAAIEIMSRYAADPHWLIYLPPTMSPCETSGIDDILERPLEAFAYYQKRGVSSVVCEQKHMGSRAVIVVCKDASAAKQRFMIQDGSAGIIYTRTGRHFFHDASVQSALLARVRQALSESGFWAEFNTDWVCLDTELMPWSAKAQLLLEQQYAPTGCAGVNGLAAAVAALQKAAVSSNKARVVGSTASGQNVDIQVIGERYTERADLMAKYTSAYRQYCWDVESTLDYRIAPFHILATEGMVHSDKNHIWHMETIKKYLAHTDPVLVATNHILVDLTNQASIQNGIDWWNDLTASGGEGMVVKPLNFVAKYKGELLQPAVKCRGREYLRIIYGPEYTLPDKLTRLKKRSLGKKRSLALREFALGMEALGRFVKNEPLYRVHECVFGVLALESEPVDPRL
ncbi:polynucleotide kinase-phosphatase|uniref:Polynucleotide 3'-phosphatase /polynucleotide 5'-hydroxyl-kinase /polynucleotide 2',3'-cyclic phosphate phosphodiesterase n=1 Tax=Dendrosporobacter quercicolus TaxID=146817 RepID=A0A1G9LZ23_9FIRM|nr:polynucleotide kinase-phosphatase [Dendrosporobacter quercicolus]NSL46861.1 polynucleotide kinase-phosphatase [Dendrosporobacter quercicolus DSM 1736]SDL67186.1 polynucleotide 3'-phosphatase /polynucleotide 5'-hydroxyl-kinase /polynucleotide 2',3'-cyclic phosphate phosphodiesterase [Dendrosporobacter quercicolus]